MNAATLSIFHHLYASVAEEMGVTLGRSAYSPNIKERLDYSCAVFLGDGSMLAQAAHIPVHLGAMPASVQAAIARCQPFEPGDVVILNNPFLGGTHLPDVTLVSPVFIEDSQTEDDSETAWSDEESATTSQLVSTPKFFVASRAHHADVGGMSPGSMPVSSEIFQEGLIIPPLKLVSAGRRNNALWELIVSNVRTPSEREGDLSAQMAAHSVGQRRLAQIVGRYGLAESLQRADDLMSYAERMTRAAISRIPAGSYHFRDYLDNDGRVNRAVPIEVTVTISGTTARFDFTGTSAAVAGNLNAVPAIVESAVAYCVRCLALASLKVELPMNQGALKPIEIQVEAGSLLDPLPPHAVAAGNVETSQRLVDVVFGALAQALPELIPAASQGTMNNMTFGLRGLSPGSLSKVADPVEENIRPETAFTYYETMGGGAGAGPSSDGGHAIHTHMSNTRNTPIEALEHSYPVRILEYRLRRGSGGQGMYSGGDGLIRTFEFLAPVTVTLVAERRERSPYGLNGGKPGAIGKHYLIRGTDEKELPGKVTLELETGDVLRVETPGGGGWGVVHG